MLMGQCEVEGPSSPSPLTDLVVIIIIVADTVVANTVVTAGPVLVGSILNFLVSIVSADGQVMS